MRRKEKNPMNMIKSMTIRYDRNTVSEFTINGEDMLKYPISELAVRFRAAGPPEIIVANSPGRCLWIGGWLDRLRQLTGKLRST